jgi:hypothetical protein
LTGRSKTVIAVSALMGSGRLDRIAHLIELA